MKVLDGRLQRGFPAARWALCAVVVMLTANGLATPTQACGVITHTRIAERAIDALDESEYPELKALLREYQGIVNYGSMFPDWAVAVHPDLGELTHDTEAGMVRTVGPFRAALIAELLPDFRQTPQSEKTRKSLAFLFGVISHQVADIPYHFGQGIQPMTEQAGIPHWRFELASDVMLYDGESVQWFLPQKAVLAAYRKADVTDEFHVTALYLRAGYLEQRIQHGLEKAGGIVYDLGLTFGKPDRREKSDAIESFLGDYRPGGMQDGAEWTVEAWQETWDWLHTYTPVTTVTVSPAQPDGSEGWYASQPVTITLGATDNFERRINTGPFVILYSLDGGITYQQYTAPLVISLEGIYNITFYSIDSMGIAENVQNLTLQIDSTVVKVGADQAQTP